jgi:hypothetical protein
MKKKLLWAFLLLVIICGILLFLVGRYTDRIVDPYVRSLLEEQKPMNHRIEYGKIKVNLIAGLIKIMDVRIYPDSSLVEDENLWFEINVSTIKMTDFSIWKMMFHKTLIIGDLICIKPEVYMHLPLKPADEVIEKVAEEKKPESKAPLLTNISLDRIILSGGTFQLIRNDTILASSPDINFTIQQIKLIKNSKDDPIGYTYGDVSLYLSSITLNPESGLYNMSLGSFSYSKKDTSAVLKEFRMIPKYDKKDFFKHVNFQGDRLDVKVGRIDIDRVGMRRLIAGQPLNISRIRIDSVEADIFRDKNVPVDLNRFPLFYNESFMKLSLPIRLDTVMITNSRLVYSEIAEGNTVAGEIILDDFSVSTYALSNLLTDSTIVHEMRLFVKAKVMGEGPMNLELALPLEGNLREFRCTGSVGAMKLFPVNGMLQPTLNMIFKAGKLNRMTFDFTGNDNVSKGWMEFLYQDLDAVVLNKESGKEKGFVSFMANAVTLSNNPAQGKDLKIVEIGFDRNKNKGLIGYVWRTIQSGMVRTIIPTKKYEINKKPPAAQKEKEKDKEKKKKGK